jgi:hydroxymethylglutaryl-CoA reductase (NADPH)
MLAKDFEFAFIPQKVIGPVRVKSECFDELISVPLATYESPLWPSVQRGARVFNKAGGIQTTVISQTMTRSIAFQVKDGLQAKKAITWLEENEDELDKIVKTTSNFCKIQEWHHQIVGNLVYIRFKFFTADAAGHNMATKAADAILDWILKKQPSFKYISVSGNICADKKPQAINGLLGRGKYVIAEGLISKELCQKYLRATPKQLCDLNLKKNYIGSSIAGNIRAANAHFANMLLAFYLSTGQDAANIIEGSQGFTFLEETDEGLYCSVTLPNIIVGVHGNGKALPFVKKNLELLNCHTISESGESSSKLAQIAAAVVLCGEISLLAAQCNPGELVQSHMKIERQNITEKITCQ